MSLDWIGGFFFYPTFQITQQPEHTSTRAVCTFLFCRSFMQCQPSFHPISIEIIGDSQRMLWMHNIERNTFNAELLICNRWNAPHLRWYFIQMKLWQSHSTIKANCIRFVCVFCPKMAFFFLLFYTWDSLSFAFFLNTDEPQILFNIMAYNEKYGSSQ